MPLHPLLLAAALLSVTAAVAPCQQSAPPVAIVQPGAPGQATRTLTPATAVPQPHPPSQPDIAFMQGMIMHHSQAVTMTAMIASRSQSKEVEALGQRISISQSDEMRFMKQWLQDRGKPLSLDSDMGNMPGMDMSSTSSTPMMMPGMLTPQQMDTLAKSTGPEFDHLFLTGMIQHHTGALTMVQQLFNTAGAAQDPQLFDFATDVDNTQQAEIRIMRAILQNTSKDTPQNKSQDTSQDTSQNKSKEQQ
jgi:uncharacterized protein (DUF305 family)